MDKVRLLRSHILRRDHRRCSQCRESMHLLQIHHRNGNHADNRFSNLITLCRSCHYATHRLSRDKSCIILTVLSHPIRINGTLRATIEREAKEGESSLTRVLKTLLQDGLAYRDLLRHMHKAVETSP